MANNPSALKRARQSEVRRMRNRVVKTRIKTVVKQVRAASSQEAAVQDLRQAQSVIDKAARKGVIHKKTAARKISRLVAQVKQAATD